MAKNDNAGTAGAPAMDSGAPAGAPTFTNEQLARLAKGAEVTVFDVDKDGSIKVDAKTKQKLVVTRPITAADILDHAVRGNAVTIVTIDGQKVQARL